jgi:(1->4)-alpha-D-glucan 1-alpha-D-glucosylmutase
MMRPPIATYRIQFNSSFDFIATKKIVSYLAELGISHVYASPIFKSRKGSLHGYDVVDTNRLNPELGSEEDFEELVGELKNYQMGWLQDFTPNHMAYDYENQMLMDVLENGQSSKYFDFFDAEWNHPHANLRGRLLAPFLGRLYRETIRDGEIRLSYDAAGLAINCHDLKFPLRMESYEKVLSYRVNKLEKELGKHHSAFPALIKILSFLKALSNKTYERHDQVKFIKKALWELSTKNQEIKSFIDERIKTFNGRKGNPESFNFLDNLLSEQLFRLSFWKVATEEINYRRFFNINELISLRMEDENVFKHIHSLIFKMIAEGKIDGIRIDHVDGLYDPTNYLKKLIEKIGNTYIVVEKILNLKEDLSSYWPIQGTTGYDFLNNVNGVFCDQKNGKEFDGLYRKFIGFKTPYLDLLYEKKKLIIQKHMTGDIDNLTYLLKRTSSRDKHESDITHYALKEALIEVMTHFPIYRTYASYEIFSEIDRSYLKDAVRNALRRRPDLLYEINFISRFLLLDFENYFTEEEKRQWIHFVMRFQQFTGPLMAKGFEDTVLYIYNRLLSLNEVGGSPDEFGISLEKFHDFNAKRANLWPHSMNTTSTHDTKRGEDVRARIHVLSELPQEWGAMVKRWSRINHVKKRTMDGVRAPDRNDEYFLYQTLIGAFPFDEGNFPKFVERIKNYMIKAVREAKVHTMWLEPDKGYEDAFVSFIEEILKPSDKNQFLKEFLPFQKKVAHYGMFNSLSQTLVKITSPGVPDFYQGAELWDLNLVDPDNRRPVDFEKRRSFLHDMRDKAGKDVLKLVGELLSTKEDGRIKSFLTYRALGARKENLDIFQKGSYVSLEVGGKFKDHIIAFARNHERSWAVTVAPRFLTALIKEGEYPLDQHVWGDTYIVVPDGVTSWRDAITARLIKSRKTLPIGEILEHFPVALLISEGKK